MSANDTIAQAVKDPDAAAAKKLLAEIEAVAPRLARAREGLRRILGEGSEMVPPERRPPTTRGNLTPLGRSFFIEAERMLADITRDATVIENQIRELRGKV